MPEKVDHDIQENELAKKEIQIQKLLKEIEDKRKEAFKAKKDKQHYMQALSRSKSVASELAYNEEQTRHHLIDSMLRSAGWDVKAELPKKPHIII